MAYDMAFSLQQTSLKADFTTRLSDSHKLNYGVNGFYYFLDPGTYLPFNDKSLVVPDKLQREQALETAFYISDTWDITPEFSVEMGIRYNYFAALGPKDYYLYDPTVPRAIESITDTVSVAGGKTVAPYHGPEFRLSMRYAFTSDFSIKAGFNSMRQNIHMLSNTTVISPTDIWKLSDANIRPQKGWQAAMGLYKT
jgi:outer membrane receptor protein involved in Fe transport